ncbi:MAG TPA: hypothetical protein VII83_00825, partial [Gaiellaceae bacterium]
GDPRLPLELALVKATRPAADLSWDALAHRLELLEQRPAGAATITPPPAETKVLAKKKAKAAAKPEPAPAPDPAEQAGEPEPSEPSATDSAPETISVELERLQEAWQRSIVPAIASIPARSIFQEAHPVTLEGTRLGIEFPHSADFHRKMAADEKNAAQLSAAIYELTGARLSFEFVIAEKAAGEEKADAGPASTREEDLISLFKDTLDAQEVED